MHAFIEGYVGAMTSWWWLGLASFAFIATFAFMLKEDEQLSTPRAVLLVFVGLVSLVPVVRHAVPMQLFEEFDWQWMNVGQDSLGAYVITYAVVAMLFAPICAAIVVGLYFAARSDGQRTK